MFAQQHPEIIGKRWKRMYEETHINAQLELLRPRCENKTIPVKNFLYLVSNILRKYKIITDVNCAHDIAPGNFDIHGFYDPESDEIELVFQFPPNDKETFTLNNFDDMLFRISLVVQHELIHRYQDEMKGTLLLSMKKRYREDFKDYLSEPDEIYARAHDILLELKHYRFPIQSEILSDWRELFMSSETFRGYYLTFDKDKSHPVLKRLMKITYQYIDGYNNERRETKGNL